MKNPSPDHVRADELLGLIAEAECRIQEIQAHANEKISKIKEEYSQKLERVQADLKKLQKELKGHMKRRQHIFFDGIDRVDLDHGALLYRLEARVKRARGVLEKLEEHGFDEAVKIAKSVDWDVLEAWPAEKLVLVGTARVQKELFEYETTGAGKNPR